MAPTLPLFTLTNQPIPGAPPAPAPVPGAPAVPTGVFDPQHLVGLAKWGSAGFVALSGIVTFFGLQSGALDRIVAEDPSAVLGVFVLVGMGVVASLLARATNPAIAIYIVWVVIFVALQVLLARLLLSEKYLPSVSARTWVTFIILICLFGVVALTQRWRIAVPAALLVIAVTSISIGLFVAVGVSVTANRTSEELRVNATLVRAEDGDSVQVHLTGSRQLKHTGRLIVSGIGPDKKPFQLGNAIFSANGANRVKETYSFPVDRRTTDSVVVRACVGSSSCDVQDLTTIKFGTAGIEPQLEGSLARATKSISTHLKATRVREGQSIRFFVTADGKVAAAGRLHPDATGTVAFDKTMPGAKGAVVLTAQLCDTSCAPAEKVAQLAANG